MNPKVSVVMAVYNGERYLREAIESILNQTFTDFEFIIIDDSSTDATRKIILSFTDPRIQLLANESNVGLTASLNRGLSIARGEYVARMDCDDISLPERLARQVAYLDRNPDVGACGTWAFDIDERGKVIGQRETITGDDLDKFYWRTSLIHSAAMFRFAPGRSLRYDTTMTYAQDYDLWLRIRGQQKLRNLPEYLLSYRVHGESISDRNYDEQIRMAYGAFCRHLQTQRISFEGFLAVMGRSYDYNPIKRAVTMSHLARRTGNKPRIFLRDNLDYLQEWSLRRQKQGQVSLGVNRRALRLFVLCVSLA
jgi:glycosyltransferase involved in cell wall biosynthesis